MAHLVAIDQRIAQIEFKVAQVEAKRGPEKAAIVEAKQYAKFQKQLDKFFAKVDAGKKASLKIGADKFVFTPGDQRPVLTFAGQEANNMEAGAIQAFVDSIVVDENGNPIDPTEPVLGQTFTLTTGVDELVGTAGNDTFRAFPVNPANGADATTLQSFDTIDGGDGVDTLNIVVGAEGDNNVQQGTVKNVEIINIDNRAADGEVFGGGNLDASGFEGATLINQIGDYADITELSSSTTAQYSDIVFSGEYFVGAADDATSANVAFVNVGAEAEVMPFGAVPGVAISVLANVQVQGDSLSAVNVTVTEQATAKAGDDVEGLTLINDAVGVVVVDSELSDGIDTFTLTSSGALVALNIDGEDLTSIDATGAAGGVAYEGQIQSFKSGAASDAAFIDLQTAADIPVTAANEARDGLIDLGAGDDFLGAIIGGNGKATVELGSGNDFANIEVGDAVTQATINAGSGSDSLTLGVEGVVTAARTITVNMGSEDDELVLVDDLAALIVDNAGATSKVTFDGGSGFDTIEVNDNTFTANDYIRIGLNVKNFEEIVFAEAATAIEANKLAMGTLSFSQGGSVTGVSATNVIQTAGNISITAAGFVANTDVDTDTLPQNFGGALAEVNVLDDSEPTVTANAASIVLNVKAEAEEAVVIFEEDRATLLTAAAASLTGNLQSATVNVESVRGSGLSAGGEATSTFTLGAVTGLTSIKVNGAGSVTIDANSTSNGAAAPATSLATIDLSGMVQFLDLNEDGEPVFPEREDDALIAIFDNLSTSTVTLSDIVQTVTLGGAQDTIVIGGMASTVAKTDTITGFTVVDDAAMPGKQLDEDRSDFIEIGVMGANLVKFADLFEAGEVIETNFTLLLGQLDDKLEAGQFTVFVSGGDTYIFGDTAMDAMDAPEAQAETGDFLVKLTGILDVDLVAEAAGLMMPV